MNKRIVDDFRVGEKVEITFGDGSWLRAAIFELSHPGLWVQDEEGRRWFVTNKRRIRRQQDEA